MSGAYEESLVKHVRASRILDYNGSKVKILDIGFGLGYNLLAFLTEYSLKKPGCSVDIVSMEYDRSFEKWIDQISFNDDRAIFYDKIKIAYHTGEYSDDKTCIRIMFGDARVYVKELADTDVQFDAVFQDAYSPAKNPELWTYDFFCIIKSIMKSSSVLTTYSAAPQIRMALLKAGFKVGKAESTGMKKEGTVAFLSEDDRELSNLEKRVLSENIKSTVYRDETLTDSRETILNRRLKEMEAIREDRRAHLE
jgi:tRNA U34 5-methylaminomethyl-2-thiouridine-forming methyltransferase MnmC